MPLDHNIFLQAAQMTENRNQNLLNNLSNSVQNAQLMKLKKQELAQGKGFDLEKLAGQALIKREMGVELAPQEVGVLKAYDTLQTRKLAVDPVTGGYYKPNASLFEGSPQYNGMARPADQPQPVGFNIPPMDDLGGDFPTGGKVPLGAPLNVNDLLPAETPEMDARRAEAFQRNTAMQNNGFDIGAFEPAIPRIDVPPELMNNRGAKQKYLESAATKAAEVQSGINQTAQDKVSRNAALNEIGSALDKLIQDAEGTPSGILEAGVAKVSSLAGKPNPQAIAKARFESGKAITGLQTRIAFLKGQGTITDAEAAQAMAFIPSPDDPYEVKVEKLRSGKDYISELTGSKKTNAKTSSSWEEYFQ